MDYKFDTRLIGFFLNFPTFESRYDTPSPRSWFLSLADEEEKEEGEGGGPLGLVKKNDLDFVNKKIRERLPVSDVAPEIFNHNYIAKLHTDYRDSNSFKHVVVEELFEEFKSNNYSMMHIMDSTTWKICLQQVR